MSVQADRGRLQSWLEDDAVRRAGATSVAEFVPGPGIEKLLVSFDIHELQAALEHLRAEAAELSRADGASRTNEYSEHGFDVISLTQRPGQQHETGNDLSGRYWLREQGETETAFEDIVNERDYSELVPHARGTYFEHVHSELNKRFVVGRMRVLSKAIYNCNSWHRDPEPRVHVPIISNPGSLFVVNHHCTHVPADGSAYFTDTRGYHTALNGGLVDRVHLVAAIAGSR